VEGAPALDLPSASAHPDLMVPPVNVHSTDGPVQQVNQFNRVNYGVKLGSP
jgi:hypothetical protein